jgi:RNA polymerase sigma-70 factor (sigma-E family)
MKSVDELAFRDFVETRSPGLLRTAYLLTGDRGLAEDAVQATLGRVYVSWDRIRALEAADAYTRRALVREVSSWRRRRRVTHVLTAQVPERPTSSTPDASEDRDEIRNALLRLPPRQRAVVVLRYFDDLAEADVASLLGISTGAVKQHTSRALARLRAVLNDESTAIDRSPR